jgi:DNA-binding CsgD family transcriptional regulator/GAF domain-containing protein
MDQSAAARRTEEAIVRLCHAGLDSRALRVEVVRRLRKVIPIDAVFCATVDPATLLFTGSLVEEIPESATPAFLANEFLQSDVTKFVVLARAARPVQSLYEATQGEPDGSLRYREILAPMGFGDELRAALRIGSVTWGVMCLHRELAGPGFTAVEEALLERIAPHLAVGLRTALLIDEATADPGPDGPGLVVLADDLSVAAVTAPAERWLGEMSDWPQRNEPPQAVRGVAARLLALEHAGEGAGELMPRARVQTRSGQWLVLHAARLSGPGGGQIAVILEPAAPAEVTPLVLQAYGLTSREAQVAQLVLKGLSTNEIVTSLFISALTVQEHLKSIFDKTGVHSRRELVAQVFAQQYLPRMMGGAASPAPPSN